MRLTSPESVPSAPGGSDRRRTAPQRSAQTPWIALALAGLAVVLSACGPKGPSTGGVTEAAAANPAFSIDDGRPQTGLRRLKLYLGARELSAELALTDEAIRKGMMWRTNVPETDAMLFVFGRPHQTSFWMKNVPMDIDVAYLDPEGVILEIHRLERQNTNPVAAKTDRVQYALETAEGWFARNGLKPGAVVRTEIGSLRDTFFRAPAAR